MDYCHSLLAEKSWFILQRLKSEFRFILIGGWAVYLWAKAQRSQDIDIIVDFQTLSELKARYDLRKNERLRKYEIRQEETDIDIYIPHYSRLAMPLEEIKTETIEGFAVPRPEYLLILKQAAEMERAESQKGEKDRVDIMSLLFSCAVDFTLYSAILKKHNAEHLSARLKRIVKNFSGYNYLDMTPRQLRLKKNEVLEKMKHI